MTIKVAINGYGRIGRCVLRAFYESTNYADLRIVAINDLADMLKGNGLWKQNEDRFFALVKASGH